jgi:hypothetical protein
MLARQNRIACSAFVVAALIVWIPAFAETAAHAQSGQKRDGTGDDESKNYTPIPTIKLQSKAAVYLPNCANPKNNDEADLCEQMRMADAAKESLRVNYLQLGLGVGAAVIGGLAAAFTGWAAWAASRAAREAARSVDVQIRIEQPLLYVEKIHTNIDTWKTTFTVRNIGKTPALLLEWSAELNSLDEMPSTPAYRDVMRVRGTVMRADDDGLQLEVNLTEGAATRIYGGGELAGFWGHFRYEDVFGRTRRTGFAYQGERILDDPNDIFGLDFTLSWSRVGGAAYNYDREEPQK